MERSGKIVLSPAYNNAAGQDKDLSTIQFLNSVKYQGIVILFVLSSPWLIMIMSWAQVIICGQALKLNVRGMTGKT